MTRPTSKASIIFVLGAPGSGKGTICKKLSQDFGFLHISVGDFMRDLGTNLDFDVQPVVHDYVRRGELLPVEIMIPILRTRIDEEMERGNDCFLIDGFPRDASQAIKFREEVEYHAMVILFKCPKETAKQRYLTRKLPGRLDDDEVMFEKRFTEFERKNPSIMDFFKWEADVEEIDSSTETEVTYAKLLENVGDKYGWEKKGSEDFDL